MRLSGWTRIGIVLSVLWTAGSFFYYENFQEELLQALATECAKIPTERLREVCVDNWRKSLQSRMPLNGGKIFSLMAALGPVPFGWIFGFIVLRLARWIRAGFHRSPI